MDVTQTFYEKNEDGAIDSLQQENKKPVFGINLDPLKYAITYRMYDFVAHDVAQRSCSKIWYNGNFHSYRDLYSNILLFFMGFLFCFSAFVLTNINDHYWPLDWKNLYEYLSYMWILADILAEYGPSCSCKIEQTKKEESIEQTKKEESIEQTKKEESIEQTKKEESKLCRKFRQWIRQAYIHLYNFWNFMDALSYLVVGIAIIFRFAKPQGSYDLARKFYSIALFLMYMRLLHYLLIHRTIGPAIIMLKEGLKELVRFLIIMVVFITSAGVLYHANLYPNHFDLFSPFGVKYWSFWKIFYLPYWSIYGEFKSELDGDLGDVNCSFVESDYMNYAEIERCPEKDTMVSVMSGLFALLSNLLLVNLIIAMFSFRFQEIRETANTSYLYQRGMITMAYKDRWPTPFNLLRPLHYLYKIKECITKDDNSETEKDKERLQKQQELLASRWVPSDTMT